MEPLTKKQSDVLEFLIAHVERWGTQPSVRDIGRFLGGVNPNGVMNHLRALERKGRIRLSNGGRSRGVEFVGLRFQRVAT